MSEQDFMGGGESLKFEKIGDTHKGKVIGISSRTDTKPDGTAQKWTDGTDKKVFMWELELEDDTVATLWVRGNLVKVLREASQKAGAKRQGDLMGAKISVKHHAVGEPKSKGFQGAKLYQAKVELAPEGERGQGSSFDPFASND